MQFHEGEQHQMTWARSAAFFVLGVSPFAAIVALAQNAHFHERLPEPLIAWFFHQNTLTIAFAGLMGGLADVILNPPKGFQDRAARVFFAVISSIMLIPAIVDAFFKDASISMLMFGGFLAAMGAQRLVPILLKRFESGAGLMLVEKTTTTLTEKKETAVQPKQQEGK